jgi:hypothetical protein
MEHIDRMFDYKALAKKFNIGQEALVQLEKKVREEFPWALIITYKHSCHCVKSQYNYSWK